MPAITPMLWFDTQAQEAADFYCSIFPNSRILATAYRPENVPGKAGEVMVVDFELDGWRLSALNAGPLFKFTEAISLTVNCKDQAEIDYYWDALIAGGGAESMCGWLKDKYGLSWQITPAVIPYLLSDPEKAGKAMAAVMSMRKLDLGAIEAAANG